MATQVQNRRGTTAEHSTFTGANGELTVDTTKRTLVVHDGATAGGRALLREDQSNLPTSAPTTGIYNASGSLAISTSGVGRVFVDASGVIKTSGTEIQQTTASNFIRISGSDGAGNGANIITFGESHSTAPGRIALTAVGTGAIIGSTGGSERLRITSAGLVGVGTSSPNANYRLDTAGAILSSGSSSEIAIANRTTNAAAWAFYSQSGEFNIYDWAAGQRRLVIDSSGRVGVGTTSPLNQFVVSNGGAAGIEISPTGFSGNPILVSYNRSGAAYTQLTLDGATNVFAISGAERARIDSSGRLLVGTSSGQGDALLQVQGLVGNSTGWGVLRLTRGLNTAAIGANVGALLGDIDFGANDNTTAARIRCESDASWSSTSDTPGRLVFSTTADGASSPTERMRIGADGNIGIGAPNEASIKFYSVATGSLYAGYFAFDGATGQGVGIKSNGTSPAYPLYFFNDGVLVGSVYTTSTSTAYNTSSDYRLKENVTPVTDGIARLQQLKPSRFNFIADPTKMVDGFIAHEVQAIVPEAITGEKDAVDDEGNPQYQGIDQSKLVPLLTAALQEAIGEIESLKARVAALEGA